MLFSKIPCRDKKSDIRIIRLCSANEKSFRSLQTKKAEHNPNFISLFKLIENYSQPSLKDGEEEGKEAK